MNFLVFKLYFYKAIFEKKEEHRLGDLRGLASVPVPPLPWPRQVAPGLSEPVCKMELLKELWEAVRIQGAVFTAPSTVMGRSEGDGFRH